jgi:hypothetical protein
MSAGAGTPAAVSVGFVAAISPATPSFSTIVNRLFVVTIQSSRRAGHVSTYHENSTSRT